MLLRGSPGTTLRAFSGVFTEFLLNVFRKVPAVLGVWPSIGVFAKVGERDRGATALKSSQRLSERFSDLEDRNLLK